MSDEAEAKYSISLNTLSEIERIRINIAFSLFAEALKDGLGDFRAKAKNCVEATDALFDALGFEDDEEKG
jgi:hypothetical protein